MSCPPVCPREQISQDLASPGPVSAHEYVCRAGYGATSHYNKKGSVRPALIRTRDLLAGELSVWRLSSLNADVEIEQLVEINGATPPLGNTLWHLFAVQASEVRQITTASADRRVLSLLDDCRTGTGTPPPKHSKHATIAICEHVIDQIGNDESSPLFLEIKEELFAHFRKLEVWASPDAQQQITPSPSV